MSDADAFPDEVATQDNPAVSPSGDYLLAVVADQQDGFQTQRFQILNKDEEVLYDCPDHFLSRALTLFLWDAEDRVWVYSGDLGTFFWQRRGDRWEKFVYAESDVPAPEFLKEIRPRWHTQ